MLQKNMAIHYTYQIEKKDNYDALYVYFIEATQENHK